MDIRLHDLHHACLRVLDLGLAGERLRDRFGVGQGIATLVERVDANGEPAR